MSVKSKIDAKIDTFLPTSHPFFSHFGSRKSLFLDFFKVILELF